MFEIDDPARKDRAVRAAHTVTSRLEVWADGVLQTESAPFIDGAVSNDWVVAGITRSLSVTVPPSRDWLRWFDSPNLQLRPFRGIRYSGSAGFECPLGVFPVLPPDMSRPVSSVKITADDYYQRVVQADFSTPTMAPEWQIVDTLYWLVSLAGSGVSGIGWPVIRSSSRATSPGVLMDKTRHDAVVQYAKAGNFEVFFDRVGDPIIDDARVLGAPTSEVLAGNGQSAVGVAAKADWAKVYNMVSVTSSAQDIDFDAQVAAITDPNHPAHPSRIGFRVMKYSSPLITYPEQAMVAAYSILGRVAGLSRSYTYQCIPDPTRDAGDSILGATMTGTEVAQILNVTTPLGAKGAQTITTVGTNTDPG